jgi:multiple sugar transport system permease protein
MLAFALVVLRPMFLQVPSELEEASYVDGCTRFQACWMVVLRIYGFIGAEFADWHRVMAFASIYVLPILALFLLLQNKIVSGLTAGALK